ncbi:MAG: hypothetical protein NTZ05_15870, partial [Chloroflexi bacterium]|nr:hypothetical protein [Chloroflexota bacterium]
MHRLLARLSLSVAALAVALVGTTDPRIADAPAPPPIPPPHWDNFTDANDVRALAVDGDTAWVGSNGGLVAWNLTRGTYVKYTRADGLSGNVVNAIVRTRDGALWFATNRGLSRFGGGVWSSFTPENSPLPAEFVATLLPDPDGVLWAGTNRGLVRFTGDAWTLYDHSNSALPDDWVRSLAPNPAGGIWVGTTGGAALLRDGAWTVVKASPETLPDNAVAAIAAGADGKVWFGTFGGGVATFDGGKWTTFRQPEVPLISN